MMVLSIRDLLPFLGRDLIFQSKSLLSNLQIKAVKICGTLSTIVATIREGGLWIIIDKNLEIVYS